MFLKQKVFIWNFALAAVVDMVLFHKLNKIRMKKSYAIFVFHGEKLFEASPLLENGYALERNYPSKTEAEQAIENATHFQFGSDINGQPRTKRDCFITILEKYS